MELLDVVDENDKPTGEQLTRDEIHDRGLWHRSSHIWMYSDKGNVLLQLRSKDKKENPSVWDISVAGHASAGDDPLTAAKREAKEELGIDIDTNQLELIKVMKMIKPAVGMKELHYQFLYIYMYRLDENVRLIFNDGEVDQVAWKPLQEFIEDVSDSDKLKQYVQHTDKYFKLVIDELKSRILL